MGELLQFAGRRTTPDEIRMGCVGCGGERTIPLSAAITPCPACGSTVRSTVRGVETVNWPGLTTTNHFSIYPLS